MARVTHVDTALPAHALYQEDAASAVRASLGLSDDRSAAIDELFRRAQVATRYSVMDRDTLVEARSLSQSMDLYRRHAMQLGLNAAKRCLRVAKVDPSEIDMVVTCSCTGLLLPSLSVLIASELGLRSDVRRVPITEAGCAGGASALARAYEFARAFPQARVLVLAVELPTLTLQRGDRSRSNLVASALFGDGAAAALVQGDDVPRSGELGGTEIVATSSTILPSSIEDLGFDLRDGGLHIVLSKRVPEIIATKLPGIVDDLLAKQGLRRSDLSFFVMHPGGRKILDTIEKCLGLQSDATRHSREVLRNYGNQSSASVLFVLQKTLSGGIGRGKYGLLAAFGPGITVELSLLRGTP